MPLKISSQLSLPDEAVTQTFGILAKRGVGKTYTAAVIVEEMLKANLPVVVCDPIGVWWGLRSSADGKKSGLPIVVVGGDHGDVPLELTAGKVIADLVVDDRLSLVIDLSVFRKGEQIRFMTDFAERLYHRNRQPVHLVLDEADAFAPQKPMGEQSPRLLGAIEDLVRRGRARGIGVTLISQRSAVLNKDVLTQIEVLVAMRTIGPQDRDAIDAWIKVHGTPDQRKELMESLPSLPIGTAWFWSPGWLDLFRKIKVRKRETFDSSATPEMGAPVQAVKLAAVDLDVLRDRIAGTIERAKADDPKELRRQIADLRKQLTVKPSDPEPVEIERIVEVPFITDEELAGLHKTIGSLASAVAELTATVAKLEVVHGLVHRVEKAAADVAASRRAPLRPVRHQAAPRPTSSPRPIPAAIDGDQPALRAGARKMLDVLARHREFKVTRAQLGTLAGFSPRGGTFGTYLGDLKRAGLIVEHSGVLSATEAGFEYLGGPPAAPTSTEEVLDQWRSALRAGERQMLDELVAAYPNGLSRAELAERTNFTVSGGTFSTYLGVLRRNGLIEVEGTEVRASEVLFIAN